MLEIILSPDKEFISNSKIMAVRADTKYLISTRVAHKKGDPFSAYFGVIFLDKDNKEIERRIKWLNDAAATEQTISIISKALTERMIVIYRINAETPLKSECQYGLLPISNVSISETDTKLKESFENVNDCAFPRPEELTKEQELVLERNVVWVFGSARSGTTWLGKELLSYNTKIIDELRIAEHLGFITGGSGFARYLDQNSNRPDYFFSKRYENTWKYFLRKSILNRIHSQILNLSHKIIIKEPMTVGAPDIISKCMPQSKVIILLRDGRDLSDSILDARSDANAWGVKDAGYHPRDPNNRLQFIERYAKTWVTLMQVLMQTYHNHAPNLRILIRYEDLRQNTLEELQKIYQFLQINIKKNELENIVRCYSFENIPSELKGQGKFRRFATPGKWKENFSEEEKAMMEKIMGSTLREYGY